MSKSKYVVEVRYSWEWSPLHVDVVAESEEEAKVAAILEFEKRAAELLAGDIPPVRMAGTVYKR